ncbi:MAG TPA: hypothetical protein VNX68_13215 [Nitrosopumilaceae archaeon]|jgi:hypothetical protein|nr:hypothetical protein [Nitrosopumilaceae archaeon]
MVQLLDGLDGVFCDKIHVSVTRFFLNSYSTLIKEQFTNGGAQQCDTIIGYTHYYKTPPQLDAVKFKTLSEELETASGFINGNLSVSDKAEDTVILCGGMGTGNPQFTSDVIAFNGEESKGTDHETFIIERIPNDGNIEEKGLVFNFCKTARKPYDLMVLISLLRLKHHFPECEISSDGDSKDWAGGKKLYKKIFKEAPPKIKL